MLEQTTVQALMRFVSMHRGMMADVYDAGSGNPVEETVLHTLAMHLSGRFGLVGGWYGMDGATPTKATARNSWAFALEVARLAPWYAVYKMHRGMDSRSAEQTIAHHANLLRSLKQPASGLKHAPNQPANAQERASNQPAVEALLNENFELRRVARAQQQEIVRLQTVMQAIRDASTAAAPSPSRAKPGGQPALPLAAQPRPAAAGPLAPPGRAKPKDSDQERRLNEEVPRVGYWQASSCHRSDKLMKQKHSRCSSAQGTAAVRCCSEQGGCSSICHVSTHKPKTCVDMMSAAAEEASAECRAQGMRLCTRAELQSDICCKSGCGMDDRWVWSSNECTPGTTDGQHSAPLASLVPSTTNPCPTRFDEGCDLPFTRPRRAGAWRCAEKALQRPPLVAHCIAGLARSFAEPVVYRAFREHVYEAFGGRAATFVYLKTWDTAPPSPGGPKIPTALQGDYVTWLDNARREALLAALQHLRPQGVKLVHSEEEQHARPNTECKLHARPGVNYAAERAYTTPAGAARHVGQMDSSLGCLRMVQQHETAHGLHFDYITRSRPDVAFTHPLPLLCFLNRAASTVLVQQRPYIDHFVLMPRQAAAAALDLYTEHYLPCRNRSWWGATFEDLLAGSITRAGFRVQAHPFPLVVLRRQYCSACATQHNHTTEELLRICNLKTATRSALLPTRGAGA